MQQAQNSIRLGTLAALGAAVLFGAGTPLAKRLLLGIDPWMLAGLLYLGSGIGLSSWRALTRTRRVRLPSAQLGWFAAAIAFGGVLGPVLLMQGLRSMPAAGVALPPVAPAAAALLVGLLAYGVSLTLFVVALRHLGSARTGAYFSVAPFVGALLAVVMGDAVTVPLVVAAALMGIGVWLHLTERHEHWHVHEALEHEHEHEHDEHHQHEHLEPVAAGVRHAHRHRHEPIAHSHVHAPDMHHRHEH